MANPTTVDDLEARWRPLSTQETINAEAFLEDAWAYLTAPNRRPALDADVTAGTVSQGDVLRVVCAMVLRVLKNPDGWAEEAIDDWRGKRSAAITNGELFATPTELADLRPATTTAKRNSVRLAVYGDG